MDTGDDRFLIGSNAHDEHAMNPMDIQPQQFLASFEDPAALTYFIHENDGAGPAIVPVPTSQGMLEAPVGPHDHAYSRIRSEINSSLHSPGSYGSVNMNVNSPLSSAMQVQPLQSHVNVISNHGNGSHLMSHIPQNQPYGVQMHPTVTSSGYPGSILCGNSSSHSDHNAVLFDSSPNSSSVSHVTESPSSKTSYNPISTTMVSQMGSTETVNSLPKIGLNSKEMTDKGLKTSQYSRTSTPNEPVKLNHHQPNLLMHHVHGTINQSNASHHLKGDSMAHHSTESQLKPRPLTGQPNGSKSTAETRTVITVRVVDQIVYQGNVVKETLFSENEIVKKGGLVAWPDNSSTLSTISPAFSRCSSHSIPSGNLEDISEEMKTTSSSSSSKSSQDQLSAGSHEQEKTEKNSSDTPLFQKVPTPVGKAANALNKSKVDLKEMGKSVTLEERKSSVTKQETQTKHLTTSAMSVKRQKGSDSSSTKKAKTKPDDLDSDEARRETASTLLSLQLNLNVDGSKDKTEDGLKNELEFGPISVGGHVLARWTDKNFYPGKVSQNCGVTRWQVHFDDGGKRVIHESEIISVPYLTRGLTVMATFSEDYCIKGIIKDVMLQSSQLYYLIEYEESGKKTSDRFARKDIFLTNDLGVALLGKQAKSPQNVSKFADVDLNNIIPKRSRVNKQVAQSPDGAN